MSVVSFGKGGLPRPAITIRPFRPDPQSTPMLPRGAAPKRVASTQPAVAIIGKVVEGGAELRSLMFVLKDGFVLEMPLNAETLGQMRAVLGQPHLPDDDPELSRPGWA